MKSSRFYLATAAAVALMSVLPAAQVPAALQAKIDAEIVSLRQLASDPAIVSAVKARNAQAGADVDAMTQEKWAAAGAHDPLMHALTTNAAAAVLKARLSAAASEVFLNAADGRKVALLSKTTSWSHKGSPKHDVPMTGGAWQGPAEMDQSSGVESIQVAVPVLDAGKPIGSIVVGLDIAKLK